MPAALTHSIIHRCFLFFRRLNALYDPTRAPHGLNERLPCDNPWLPRSFQAVKKLVHNAILLGALGFGCAGFAVITTELVF